jgi:catechol 2,3-dioxygenase-like lactoylglutathione lyase family enzyme
MLNPRGFAWAGLFAADLPKLVDFYKNKLGLRVIEEDDDYCIFDAGAGSLFEIWNGGFAYPDRKTPREQSVLIGFLIEHLESAVEALNARDVRADTEIASYLGTRWIYFTDPEGNRFELKDLRG